MSLVVSTEPVTLGNGKDEFRNYEEVSPIHEFYSMKHMNQTLEYVLSEKRKHGILQLAPGDAGKKTRKGIFGKYSIWRVFEMMDEIVDESDPDTESPQSIHAFQSAQAARADGQPRWMQFVCLIHDLGKILCLFKYPQWAVVGDTYPVGCAFSDKIVYSKDFKKNPEYLKYKDSECGMYAPHCGLDSVHMAWGHDEYLYWVIKDYVPIEVAYIIRYHSFYAWHQAGAYQHFMNDLDKRMLPLVKEFNKYDLYTKKDGYSEGDIQAMKEYYTKLIDEFIPGEIEF